MPFPRFVVPISDPPPLAMTNVASMKHSSSFSALLSLSSSEFRRGMAPWLATAPSDTSGKRVLTCHLASLAERLARSIRTVGESPRLGRASGASSSHTHSQDWLPGSARPSQQLQPRLAHGLSMPKTVMIVEDNELNMKLFHDLLEAHGYHTVATRNGIEALDLARKHRPDLILMDIQLPEVSGLEVTKWLKEDPELKAIPVVAVTAFAMRGDEERIRESGCEAYLSKPVPVAQFIDTVRSFLGGGLSMPAVSQPAPFGAGAPSPLHHRIRRGRARRTV
jgi:two-component system cell cycle response regulator DivK